MPGPVERAAQAIVSHFAKCAASGASLVGRNRGSVLSRRFLAVLYHCHEPVAEFPWAGGGVHNAGHTGIW